jgi:hypothetical protein
MFGPLFDAFEVIIVSTYGDYVSLVFETYATFIIDHLEAHNLIVEGSEGFWVNCVHRSLRDRSGCWQIEHPSSVVDHCSGNHKYRQYEESYKYRKDDDAECANVGRPLTHPRDRIEIITTLT